MREGWTFTYPATEVLAAARRCAEHHQERLTFYDEEMTKAERELREFGLSFREIEGTVHRNDVVLDPQRQARVREVRGKLQEHRDAAVGYERFVRALARNEDATLALDVDDLAYFDM